MLHVNTNMFLILLITVISTTSLADQNLSTVRDANASYQGGDLFRALGLYEMVLEKKSEKLFSVGLEGYVGSMRVLASDQAFDEFCKSLVTVAPNPKTISSSAYACAKNYLQDNKLKEAEKYLKLVSGESEWYLPAKVMMASSRMGRGDGEGCIKVLNSSTKKEYKKNALEDLVSLTLGRCKVTSQKYAEAIQDYQSISTSSKYYLEAVQEAAWLNFKLRRLETSRVLANAFITTYENFHKTESFRTQGAMNIASYFQVRYLSAYSELVQGRYDAAEGSFEKLKYDFRKYSKEESDKLGTPEKFLQDVSLNSGKWIDIHAMSAASNNFLDYLELWSGVKARASVEKRLMYLMSLQKELARYNKNSYQADANRVELIQKLIAMQKIRLKEITSESYQAASQSRNTVELKAELGRLEIGWLNRTQGVKNMDQAIEAFKQEVKSVDEYFGI